MMGIFGECYPQGGDGLTSTKRTDFCLAGRPIEPVRIEPGMGVEQLVNCYRGMGYNARRLAEACETFQKMIEEDATICLTLSGAMTPVGMSGVLMTLLENGFVDWMASTGANLYHDLHRAFDLPMVQGTFDADDNALGKAGIARIYDVFIHDDKTLLPTDEIVRRIFEQRKMPGRFSTAAIHHVLGEEVRRTAPHPEKSLLATAAEFDVPIYVPAHADSSLSMNLALNYLKGHPTEPTPSLDILESAAIVAAASKNGAVEVGGGTPKNFFMQTQPMLWQVLGQNKGGHDFFVQITDARPDTGGLSGATPSEAKSWGKVKDAVRNNVVVYADATIALPVLAAWALTKCRPRPPKRLYAKRERFTRHVIDRFKKNECKRGK
jgi:deoxyhypusine synthase